MIAATAFVFAGLIAVGCFGALRWQARSADRRESVYLGVIRDLNDRLMHLAERPMPAAIGSADEDSSSKLERLGVIRDPEHYDDLFGESDRMDPAFGAGEARAPARWWEGLRNGSDDGHPQPALEELT